MAFVQLDRLPHHLAIVMDGNGRWAEQRGQPRHEGHRRGVLAVREVVRATKRLGIPALTLYAFSEQNWGRPDVEVTGLMQLLAEFLRAERAELRANRVRLRAIGRVSRLPAHIRELLDEIAHDTPEPQMTLSIALSYGGQEEIVDGMRALAARIRRGDVTPEHIDERLVESMLPSMEVGAPDLILRTGGDQRISNFLLWGSAYAELCFTNVLWPDFEVRHLYEAIATYQNRERRFGKVLSHHAEAAE